MTETPPAAGADAATLLDIRIAPDPVLRRRTRPVTPDDRAAIRAMLPAMFETMYRAPGIGLAAPQVGEEMRFFIVDLHENDVRAPLTLINPELLHASTTLATREEGCLSLPGHYAEVTRPETVRVRFEDVDGQVHELDADGLLATCIQHELDHLDGVLFVDHLSALKRNMILRKLAKDRRKHG